MQAMKYPDLIRNKKGEIQLDFPLKLACRIQNQLLTLGELEACAGAFAAVFLAFLDAGVAGNEAGFLECTAQFSIGHEQRLGYTVTDSAGLTGVPSTLNRNKDIEFADILGKFERLAYDHFGCFTAKIVFQRFIVDGNCAGTRLEPYSGYRTFALACSVKANCCHIVPLLRVLKCQIFRLLGIVGMTGACVDLQFFEHVPGKLVLGKHTLDSPLDEI